jgi:PAS domain S-box-containing protein
MVRLPPALEPTAEIAALVEVLRAADQRLEELLAGEVDSVTDREGGTILLRRAQAHLRHQEDARQAAVLNALPACIALLDARGVIVSSNAAWQELRSNHLPHAPGHAVGVNYIDVCDPAQGQGSIEGLRTAVGIRSVLGGQARSFSIDYPRPAPTGQRWFRLHVTPLVHQTPNGAVVMHEDITERKHNETSLQESEAQFRTLAEAVPQIVWVTRADGWSVYLNRQWTDYTGLALEDSLGYGWKRSFHPDGRAQAEHAWQQATAERGVYSVESLVRRADGAYRWWLVRGTALLDADGGVQRWFGTCTDIHDLKMAELEVARTNTELSRQRVELRVLFDLVPAMIWFKDTQNNILRVNQRVAQLAGRSVLEIEGRPDAEIYPREAAQHYADDLEVIRSGTPKLGIVEPVRGGDGSELWVQTDKVPYRDESGKVIGIVVMAQDITQRKRDQDALRELNAELEARVQARTCELDLARNDAEQANQAKSAFLATMSHEIRTPMNGVIGMIEVLHQTSLKGYQVEMIDLIRDSAFSLLQIIEDILDFSRIEAGKLHVENEPMPFGETVERVCGMLGHLAIKQGVRLTLFVDPRLPGRVMGDESRLRQVLVNLAGNAIKFSGGREKPGYVSVRAVLVERRAQAVTVDLMVADNGIGIDEATLARLFAPFSQADPSTTRRFGGSGLGLAISSMLVGLMEGKISVRSVPDQGSTFTVRLDLAIADDPAPDADSTASVQGLRCRIVGDELPLADDLAAYLAHAEVIVERSPDLVAAASAAAAERPAGTSLWLILPGNGVPPLAELRQMAPGEPGAETRFIVLGWGSRRRPRPEAVDLVSVDTDVLLRRTLLRMLALASGRLQEDAAIDAAEATDEGLPAPRHEAQLQGRLILVAEDNDTNRVVILQQLTVLGFAAEIVVDGMQALERR